MGVNTGAVVKKPGSSKENLTGSWRTFKPKVTERCTGCGICVWYCPEKAIKLSDVKGKKRALINYAYCKGCLICVNECPVKAIEKEREK